MKIVRGYIHHDGSIGVLARFGVGSDFTVRTPEFQQFADDALMSLAFWCRHQLNVGIEQPDVTEEEVALVEWLGGSLSATTLQEALGLASKQFQEPITLDNVQTLGVMPPRRR